MKPMTRDEIMRIGQDIAVREYKHHPISTDDRPGLSRGAVFGCALSFAVGFGLAVLWLAGQCAPL
jgi:hypothetical protein